MMDLIIGVKDFKMMKFLKDNKIYQNYFIIDKMCHLHTIKEDVNVIIPYSIILENGLFSNTLINIVELNLSIKISKIIYLPKINEYVFKRYVNNLGLNYSTTLS